MRLTRGPGGGEPVIGVHDPPAHRAGVVRLGVASAVSALASRRGPGEERILAGYADGTVRVRAIGTARPAPLDLPGHRTVVEVAVFSPDGSYLVTFTTDNTVRIWDTVPARERRR